MTKYPKGIKCIFCKNGITDLRFMTSKDSIHWNQTTGDRYHKVCGEKVYKEFRDDMRDHYDMEENMERDNYADEIEDQQFRYGELN